ncbi:hypothetical protein P4V58_09915 [Bacillus wiedmannii]|uniref:hypothetical protein n=1 Tax=Bacillus wiedmannii TaxID=1890302 RepID=UPI002E23144F|nr:hypothetical protein [Bacillus wiedmannii]
MAVYVYSFYDSRGIVYEDNEFKAKLTIAEYYSMVSEEVDIKLKEITNLDELREFIKEPGEVIALFESKELEEYSSSWDALDFGTKFFYIGTAILCGAILLMIVLYIFK